ncbi:TlyA family RNA methyltransferase [Salipaludibacillus sp. CF4.18]|uniref:TlyA family RNA methyltransferase n=1 Tax=Salipaludibacillus sp. CF4.18 TaxID=3373081 RepID=UPI003EE4D126
MKKERIDVLLVENGLVETREKAKRNVMAGLVLANGERIDKPGAKVAVDAELKLKGHAIPYVSRGGLKLKKAIEVFELDLQDKIVLDIGASTGGFTDCSLQEGARLVYALDVGYNQLAWKLREDSRVEVMERTNFRYATKENFTKGKPNFATIDVSFISIKLILPVLKTIITEDGHISVLIKPQFEAGRDDVGKKGIIRDRKIHLKVVQEMVDFAEQLGFVVSGLAPSPIKGGEGNIEFLMHLTLGEKRNIPFSSDEADEVVKAAHTPIKD